MPKKVLIALPPAMLEQIDFIAETEHRTRSDLVREALRRYIENFKRTQSANVVNLKSFETQTPRIEQRQQASDLKPWNSSAIHT